MKYFAIKYKCKLKCWDAFSLFQRCTLITARFWPESSGSHILAHQYSVDSFERQYCHWSQNINNLLARWHRVKSVSLKKMPYFVMRKQCTIVVSYFLKRGYVNILPFLFLVTANMTFTPAFAPQCLPTCRMSIIRKRHFVCRILKDYFTSTAVKFVEVYRWKDWLSHNLNTLGKHSVPLLCVLFVS